MGNFFRSRRQFNAPAESNGSQSQTENNSVNNTPSVMSPAQLSVTPPDTEKVRKAIEFLQQYNLSNETLKTQIVDGMEREFVKGLENEEEASLKMLLTYVTNRPDGNERGTILALDLGGTNFRTLMVELPSGEEIVSKKYKISQKIMTGPGSDLFDFIAEKLVSFVIEHGNEMKQKNSNWKHPNRYPLGFTFSFPCYQFGLNIARLVRWTKGFNCAGVEDHNVANLLRMALQRNALRNKRPFNIEVVAVINDTTGTLMSCAWLEKQCSVGLIVGTGSNCCYMQRLDGVEKWKRNYEEPEMIINIEWGAFGEKSTLKDITTPADISLDKESINPGHQIFEKMIGGLYLGEVVRQIILLLVQKNLLFNGEVPASLRDKYSFDTSLISVAETTTDLKNTIEIVRDQLKIKGATEEDIAIVRLTCESVSTRAARLVASGLVAIILRMKLPETVIGYDGSVLKHHPHFIHLTTCTMNDLLKMAGSKQKFRFVVSEDGSGRGAAVVAAVAFRERRPKIVLTDMEDKDGRRVKVVVEISEHAKKAIDSST